MNNALKAELAQALSTKRVGLRFAPALENQFKQHIAPQRTRAALASGGFGLVLYVAFLLVDWLVVPDVFRLALTLRLAVITPLGLLAIYLANQHMARLVAVLGPSFADWFAAISGWAAAGTLLALLLSSHSPNAYFYHAGLMVVLLYATLVQSTRFFVAMVTAVGILAMHGLAGLYGSAMPSAVLVPMIDMVLFAVAISLMANYLAEKRHRHRYLLGLQDQLILAELQTAQEELQRLSRSDALTQVANRRHFDEYLQQAWSRASLDGSPLSMLMIDVDHFKAYNDCYGHQAGDACLKAIAQALTSCTRRPNDLVARLGGEEFGVLLQQASAPTARLTAERVCEAVAALRLPHEHSPTADWVTISVGLITVRAEAPSAGPQAMISGADQALYDAKREGRNRVKAVVA
ncbi:diguanylate cyclase [Aquabacterium sp.]|uniref:GGDEF domain-containing protein n=1 Tax=Aquabacterium sp. TaxID=1872578 RepID=UPI0019BE8EF5|nr:diguanylate cyclase [Aquabacterium sp.]MBC7701715.1 GGDEF domain-containing protein [Aquabacterium sp.]